LITKGAYGLNHILRINIQREREREGGGIDGRVILKQILKNQDGREETGLFWLMAGTTGGRL
jgi:hypothetical protein